MLAAATVMVFTVALSMAFGKQIDGLECERSRPVVCRLAGNGGRTRKHAGALLSALAFSWCLHLALQPIQLRFAEFWEPHLAFRVRTSAPQCLKCCKTRCCFQSNRCEHNYGARVAQLPGAPPLPDNSCPCRALLLCGRHVRCASTQPPCWSDGTRRARIWPLRAPPPPPSVAPAAPAGGPRLPSRLPH